MFGTGLDGVPVDGDALLPDNPPTTPMNASNFGGIDIKFPNGSFIEVTEEQGVSVTSGGMIISNSLDPAVQDATYTVTYVPVASEAPWSYNNTYPYLRDYIPGEDATICSPGWEIAFTSWSLTKSALSTNSLEPETGSENASGDSQSGVPPAVNKPIDGASTGDNASTAGAQSASGASSNGFPTTNESPPAATSSQEPPTSPLPSTGGSSSSASPSLFQGSLNGNWSGQLINGTTSTPVSGTFSVAINTDGAVQGSFVGTFSGVIAGQVDQNGNLNATGTASGGTSTGVTTWSGHISVAGNSLSGQGNWSGPDSSGTFSGTGNVS
jgi:hypothetical protein